MIDEGDAMRIEIGGAGDVDSARQVMMEVDRCDVVVM